MKEKSTELIDKVKSWVEDTGSDRVTLIGTGAIIFLIMIIRLFTSGA